MAGLSEVYMRTMGYVPCPKCKKPFMRGRHELCRACMPVTPKIKLKREREKRAA